MYYDEMEMLHRPDYLIQVVPVNGGGNARPNPDPWINFVILVVFISWFFHF